MNEQTKKSESLLDIARGKNIQKRYTLYSINQGKELLLILVNLCIIGAMVGFVYLWAKAAADNYILEWLFRFGEAKYGRYRHMSYSAWILFFFYLFGVIFWLLPKLEIKMADKIVLWIKDNQLYIETKGQTTQYSFSEIKKIELQHHQGDLREIIIYRNSHTDTIFSRPKISIPFSKSEGDVDRFTHELVVDYHMHSDMKFDGKWTYRVISWKILDVEDKYR